MVIKELEVNTSFEEMLNLSQNMDGPLDLTVTNCSFIRLTDKAFERKLPEDREERWDQNHLGLVHSLILLPPPPSYNHR